MSDLPYEQIKATLAAQPLFEDKTWQLSPEAWPITPEQKTELEAIGAACLEFHQVLETLYLRAAGNKNLLRNKPLNWCSMRVIQRTAENFPRCCGLICC
jgi:hypothetical protein